MSLHKLILLSGLALSIAAPVAAQVQSYATFHSTEGWSVTINVVSIGIVITQDFNGKNCLDGFNYAQEFQYSVDYSEPGHTLYTLQLQNGCVLKGGVNLNMADGTNATILDYGHEGTTGIPCEEITKEDYPCNSVDIYIHGPGIAKQSVTIDPTFDSRTLPIHLNDFRLHPVRNGEVRLAWEANASSGSEKFFIERSVDGISWFSIGNVPVTHREGGLPLAYAFTDAAPRPGKNYYRIGGIDPDGSMDYSRVLYARIACRKLSVFPNPVQRELRVKGGNSPRIYDVSGRDVTDSLPVSGTDTEGFLINVADLDPGVYTVRASGVSERFVRQ